MTAYGSTDRTYADDEVESHNLLPVIDRNNPSSKSAPARRIWSSVLSSMMVVIVLTTMLAFITSGKKSSGSDINAMINVESLSTTKISVIAANEYGHFDGKSYPWMLDVTGTQLVEPYKNTTLTLSGSYIKSKYTYAWSITIESSSDDSNEDASASYIGTISSNASFQTVMFIETGIYKIGITVYSSSGDVVHTYETRLVCK